MFNHSVTLTKAASKSNPNDAEQLRAHWQSTMQEEDTRKRFGLMLKNLKMFRDSALPFLQDLCSKLEPHEFEPGEHIMNQGDYGDWLCICMKGCASVNVKMGGKGG